MNRASYTELRDGVKPWKEEDAPTRAAWRIIQDLSGRSGIGKMLEFIDDTVLNEIFDTMIEKIIDQYEE